MLRFLFDPFLVWAPRVFYGASFLYGLLWYIFRKKPEIIQKFFSLRRAAWSVAIFRVAYAALATVGQYVIWSGNEFTKLLLPPHRSIWYFMGYVAQHLWLNVALSLGVGYLFYLFLKRLKVHNERFFEEGEVELGCLMSLVVGWPGFILFVPMVFLGVVLVSIFRMVVFKEQFTTLGIPFLFAAIPAMLFTQQLIDLLGWGAFKA